MTHSHPVQSARRRLIGITVATSLLCATFTPVVQAPFAVADPAAVTCQRDDLRTTLARETQRLSSVDAAIANTEAKIQELQAQIEKLQNNTVEHKSLPALRAAAEQALAKAQFDAQQAVEAAQRAEKRAKRKYDASAAELAAAQAKKNEADAAQTTATTEFNAATTALETFNQEQSAIAELTTIAALDSTLGKLSETKASLQTARAEQVEEKAQLEEPLAQGIPLLEEAQAKVETYRTETQTTTAKKAEQQAKLDTQTAELERLRGLATTLEATPAQPIAELQEEITAKEAEIAQLTAEIQALANQFEAAADGSPEKTQLGDQLEAKRQRQEPLQQDLERLRQNAQFAAQERHRGAIRVIEEKMSEVQHEIDQANTKIQGFDAHLAGIAAEQAPWETYLPQIEAAVNNLREQIAAIDAAIAKIDENLAGLAQAEELLNQKKDLITAVATKTAAKTTADEQATAATTRATTAGEQAAPQEQAYNEKKAATLAAQEIAETQAAWTVDSLVANPVDTSAHPTLSTTIAALAKLQSVQSAEAQSLSASLEKWVRAKEDLHNQQHTIAAKIEQLKQECGASNPSTKPVTPPTKPGADNSNFEKEVAPVLAGIAVFGLIGTFITVLSQTLPLGSSQKFSMVGGTHLQILEQWILKIFEALKI